MQPSLMNNYSSDFLSFVLHNDRISLSLLPLYLVVLLEKGWTFNTNYEENYLSIKKWDKKRHCGTYLRMLLVDDGYWTFM